MQYRLLGRNALCICLKQVGCAPKTDPFVLWVWVSKCLPSPTTCNGGEMMMDPFDLIRWIFWSRFPDQAECFLESQTWLMASADSFSWYNLEAFLRCSTWRGDSLVHKTISLISWAFHSSRERQWTCRHMIQISPVNTKMQAKPGRVMENEWDVWVSLFGQMKYRLLSRWQ